MRYGCYQSTAVVVEGFGDRGGIGEYASVAGWLDVFWPCTGTKNLINAMHSTSTFKKANSSIRR
jgi:hypothetical protein